MITKSVPARAGSRTFAIGIEYITEHAHARPDDTTHGFADGVAYTTAPTKAAWSHMRGVTSLETAAIEMEAVAALSRRCPDATYHLIIAYAKHERPTREQVIRDTERLLGALDMQDHQYVLAAHHDTDDFHAHVIANRVGPDGKANSLWKERVIRERMCAQIATERGWAIVEGRHNRDMLPELVRQHTLPEMSERRRADSTYRRREEPAWHELTRDAILPIVDRAGSWGELHERLAAIGLLAKRVTRGGRVQGLAFAERSDARDRGCAASRIHPRCTLRALERRFGDYAPLPESIKPEPDIRPNTPQPGNARAASPLPWAHRMRQTVLAAVDESRSWDDLRERLATSGLVVKLVTRGGRVQGLAFAAGREPEAQGCGASRIDPRCKLATLEERFGAFPPDDVPKRATVDHALDSDKHDSRKTAARAHADDARAKNNGSRTSVDPRWALGRATRIVDHLTLRGAYREYRESFFRARGRDVRDDRATAWQREQQQRRNDAERRQGARHVLRAVVRAASRAPLRSAGYWSIDALTARRREEDRVSARARWEATKISLATQRRALYEEAPMGYRMFVTDQARRGDAAAQRLLGQTQHSAPARTSSTLTFEEVRAELRRLAAREQAHALEVRGERQALVRETPPPKLETAIVTERRAITARIHAQESFTAAERQKLDELKVQQDSWNPVRRSSAARAERALREGQLRRRDVAMRSALEEFERVELPRERQSLVEQEHRYRQFVAASLALEDEMRTIDASFGEIRATRSKLDVMERIKRDQVPGITDRSDLGSLSRAVEAEYATIPAMERRAHEHAVERQRDRARSTLEIVGPR